MCIAYYVIVLYFDLVFAVNFSETVSEGGFNPLPADRVSLEALGYRKVNHLINRIFIDGKIIP